MRNILNTLAAEFGSCLGSAQVPVSAGTPLIRGFEAPAAGFEPATVRLTVPWIGTNGWNLAGFTREPRPSPVGSGGVVFEVIAR
jgi:hypothetical protein